MESRHLQNLTYVTQEVFYLIEQEERFFSSGRPILIGDTIMIGILYTSHNSYQIQNRNKIKTLLKEDKGVISILISYHEEEINSIYRCIDEEIINKSQIIKKHIRARESEILYQKLHTVLTVEILDSLDNVSEEDFFGQIIDHSQYRRKLEFI